MTNKIMIDEAVVRFVMDAIDSFFAAPDDEADQEAQEHLLSARSKLRQALADAEQPAPAQEPVAWSVTWDGVHCGNFFFREQDAREHKARLDAKRPGQKREVVPLYTTPPAPAQAWVGLTDEEIDNYLDKQWLGYGSYHDCFKEVIRWQEAKLKEKNTKGGAA